MSGRWEYRLIWWWQVERYQRQGWNVSTNWTPRYWPLKPLEWLDRFTCEVLWDAWRGVGER